MKEFRSFNKWEYISSLKGKHTLNHPEERITKLLDPFLVDHMCYKNWQAFRGAENSCSSILPTVASSNSIKAKATVRRSQESKKPPGRCWRSQKFSWYQVNFTVPPNATPPRNIASIRDYLGFMFVNNPFLEGVTLGDTIRLQWWWVENVEQTTTLSMNMQVLVITQKHVAWPGTIFFNTQTLFQWCDSNLHQKRLATNVWHHDMPLRQKALWRNLATQIKQIKKW